MKPLITLILVLLSALCLQAQKGYTTSMQYYNFGGMSMYVLTPIGNDCGNKDLDIQYSVDGYMEITVNKLCHSWSCGRHWMGSPFNPSIVFKNRYIEFRIRSTQAHDTGLYIAFQVGGGSPDGSFGKSIPNINFKINKANTWEVKWLPVGGNADTVFKEIDYHFPNGFYQIDYIYYGDAAMPRTLKINPIPDQFVKYKNQLQGVDVYLGDSIKNMDGLVMEAKPLHAKQLIDTVYLADSNCTNSPCPFKKIQYKIFSNSQLTSDSILITLKDTIHSTSKDFKFKVYTYSVYNADKSEEYDQIKVYPTLVENAVNIDLTDVGNAKIEITDINGKLLLTHHITGKYLETIDLSLFIQGVYFIRVQKENICTTKKIIKL